MGKITGRPDTSKKGIDYDVYLMTVREKLFYLLAAAIVIYTFGYVFYRSHIISAVLCTLSPLYLNIRKSAIIAKRKRELNIQFKDLLYSLSSSLSAGKPVELAFKDALRDLCIQYPYPDTYIIGEVELMVRKIEMNENIEAILQDFARRSHIDDISSFADVFAICKRTGGNMVEVMKNTSNIISDKVDVAQEIETVLAERRLERKVLNALPAAMMLLLSLSAWDYMRPVFQTLVGRAVVTLSVILLGLAWYISGRVMDIRV
jgi:tight adherence protein B